MSYEKQTLANGDLITAEKLNHMEDGIADGGGVMIVNVVSGDTSTLDKTWQEIYDAFVSGTEVLISDVYSETEYATSLVISVDAAEELNEFSINTFTSSCIADSANGYPEVTK